MRYLLMIVVGALLIGAFRCGVAVEQRSYSFSEDKGVLFYDGAVYVRAMEGTTIENYLTAAGKPKKK